MAWNHHRLIYSFLRNLIVQKTPLRNLPETEQDLLIGRVHLTNDPAQDDLAVQAIGAGAPTSIERLWRAYNQLREMAFIRNDGFAVPVVFESMDPNAPEILDASHRVNFTFLSPVGRTHYSRALMEASALGENLLITRDGRMVTPRGSKGEVLEVRDGHFWLNEAQYRRALIESKGMAPAAADERIAQDKAAGRMTPKGIRCAARFTDPVFVGSIVAHHHHSLAPALTAAGYSYTDKSDVHFAFTYDKTLYPAAYNPNNQTGVLLPPENDWLREETEAIEGAAANPVAGRQAAVAQIMDRMRPFAEAHGILIIKGAAESGARNFRRADLLGTNGQVDETALREAAEFVYEVSKGQNVTIQRAIITTPLVWMDAAAAQEFIDRQVRDFGVAVNLNRHPKDWVYGTTRVILSAGMPASLEPTEAGLFNPANWHAAHEIALSSLQVATNVGRQGTLEKLRPEMIRPEFRPVFMQQMEEAGRRVMVATARYGKKYWDEIYVPAYTAEHGHPPQEFDASGVPYWWPRYLMLDLLPEPIWGRDGQEVSNARVVDVIPGDPARGTQARFTLQTPDGKAFEGEILGFRFWLLEPNVGIGLWPNYSRREMVHEQAKAKAEGNRLVDGLQVGTADRIVLNDYLAAGEAFLRAKFGDDYFPPGGPSRKPSGPQPAFPPATPPAPAQLTTPFEAGLTTLREIGIREVGPAQVSLLCAEAARAAFSDRQTRDPGELFQLFEDVQQWLADPARVGEFPQRQGIAVSPEAVGRWLSDETYRTRIAGFTIDRFLSQSLTPPVEILPEPAPPGVVQQLLPHASTMAVVVGKTALMNHHIYPWTVGRGNRAVNIVGVHESWLTPDGKATRFMALNPQTGRFTECSCVEPIPLNQAFLLELLQSREVQEHQELTRRLEGAGVQVINPVGPAQERADDKAWLRENAPAGVGVPQTRIVPRGTDEAQRTQLLGEVISQSPSGVVVQPRIGTTEGRGVEWFAPGDQAGQAAHLGRLVLGMDALVSASRGNVTYQGRPLVLRFNVAAREVTSASAVVGPEGSHIASLGRGGETEFLEEVLAGLQSPTGEPVAMTPEAWARLQESARRAAAAVGLPIAGIDVVMEVDRSGAMQGVVLEANARPGTLIFGESVIFSEEGPIESHPAAPVGDAFWNSLGIGLEEPARAGGLEEGRTLAEWQTILANPVTSGFWGILVRRYGSEKEILNDRLAAYRQLVQGALENGFDPNQRVAMVAASPGRDRYYMGHSDSPGLGGKTINAATEEEILAVMQVTDDGYLHMSNFASDQFPHADVQVAGVQDVGEQFTALEAKQVWPSTHWSSYLTGTLAYLLSAYFSGQHPAAGKRIKKQLKVSGKKPPGIRFYAGSIGRLALPFTGGMSSSSSLTGAFAVALNALFDLRLTREQLAETDFGEYLVGKTAGAGDKTAQLFAQKGRVVVIGSFPERFLRTVEFPRSGLVVLMAEGPNRLTTPEGRQWLIERDELPPAQADRIVEWAHLTMRRFGSLAYTTAVQQLRDNLKNSELREAAHVTEAEAEAVERALMREPTGHPTGLLRELAAGGALSGTVPGGGLRVLLGQSDQGR